MARRKIGTLTIGQSPRMDVLQEMAPLWGADVEVVESGALDGLTQTEIAALAPADGGAVLVSRLRDGGWARMEEQKLLPLLQRRLDDLTARGVELIILLCTGPFPEGFACRVPLLYPQKIMYAVAPVFSRRGHLAIVSPDAAQENTLGTRWKQVVPTVTTTHFNPYDTTASVEHAVRTIQQSEADLVVLDCIGYSLDMKEVFAKKTGLPVLLPRTVAARLAMEFM